MLVTNIFILFPQCFQGASFLRVRIVWLRINPLPDDNILAMSKLKAFADDNFNMSHFFCDRVENIVGKGENAGDQYFLIFEQSW